MKTNFSTQTVSGNVSFTFADMEDLTDIFEAAALEATTGSRPAKAERISKLAEQLGFEIDLELLSIETPAPDFTSGQAGQDSDQTE